LSCAAVVVAVVVAVVSRECLALYVAFVGALVVGGGDAWSPSLAAVNAWIYWERLFAAGVFAVELSW